jgi:hypothetical protein
MSRTQSAEMFLFVNTSFDAMTTPVLMTAGGHDQVCRLQWR